MPRGEAGHFNQADGRKFPSKTVLVNRSPLTPVHWSGQVHRSGPVEDFEYGVFQKSHMHIYVVYIHEK